MIKRREKGPGVLLIKTLQEIPSLKARILGEDPLKEPVAFTTRKLRKVPNTNTVQRSVSPRKYRNFAQTPEHCQSSPSSLDFCIFPSSLTPYPRSLMGPLSQQNILVLIIYDAMVQQEVLTYK